MPTAPPAGYPGAQQSHAAVGGSTEGKKTMARNAFRAFDVDRSGYLDINEFLRALESLGVLMQYNDALAVFAIVDDNRNSRISESEFLAFYVANY